MTSEAFYLLPCCHSTCCCSCLCCYLQTSSKIAARWRYRPPITNLTAHNNSQFCVSFNFVFTRTPKNTSRHVLMGPEHTFVHFKYVCWFLLIKSWSSFQHMYAGKLDGVGPVDNRTSTNKLHHFVQKKNYIWHGTCDMWHVTRDMWHVTRDMGCVTYCRGWTFSQNFSSLALTVCDLWYYEYLEEKAQGLNESMNELITRLFIEQPRLHRVC